MSAAKISLDVVDVKDPCPEDWDGMTGDDVTRFCGTCRMNVYNLSEMTRAEAEATIRAKEDRICIRFYRRLDGTISTVDCAPIRFAKARRAARRTLGFGAMVLVAMFSLAGALGLARLTGVDLASWVESTTVGRIAKDVWGVPDEYPLAGEPMVMGDIAEPSEHLDD